MRRILAPISGTGQYRRLQRAEKGWMRGGHNGSSGEALSQRSLARRAGTISLGGEPVRYLEASGGEVLALRPHLSDARLSIDRSEILPLQSHTLPSHLFPTRGD